jgi:ribulose-phosphate 3-epimerase
MATLDIIPAIMPDSYDDLVFKAGQVRNLLPIAQIDIMDGVFVGSRSWPYRRGGINADADFLALTKQEKGMPYWEDLDYEIDLMIAEPELHIDEWLPLGASRLIFHIEAIKNSELFFGHDIFKEGARDIGGHKVVEIGLAINPDTPLLAIEPFISYIDFVQCMGIAKIGYQGQPFDERVLTHINQLRVTHPNLIISVDGGVGFETAPLLKAAGANRLVSGSAIFTSADLGEAVRRLKG